MTRIEAFVSLFSEDNEKSFSFKAVGVIAENPQPTTQEREALANIDFDVCDRAIAFGSNPRAYLASVPDGMLKAGLQSIANARELTMPDPTTMKPTSRQVGASARGVRECSVEIDQAFKALDRAGAAADLRDSLYGSGTPGQKPGGKREQVEIPRPGGKQRKQTAQTIEHHDDPHSGEGSEPVSRRNQGNRDNRNNRDRDNEQNEKPVVPPKPTSPITAEVRERVIEGDPYWARMRDATIAAHIVDNKAEIAQATRTAAIKCEGQHGPDGRLYGRALTLLLKDLRDGLLMADSAEFKRRYW